MKSRCPGLFGLCLDHYKRRASPTACFRPGNAGEDRAVVGRREPWAVPLFINICSVFECYLLVRLSMNTQQRSTVVGVFEDRLHANQAISELHEAGFAERIEPLDILDVLVDTENWLNWTRFFGPISGHDAKIDASRARYVATAFCYGCNLGPSPAALDGGPGHQLTTGLRSANCSVTKTGNRRPEEVGRNKASAMMFMRRAVLALLVLAAVLPARAAAQEAETKRAAEVKAHYTKYEYRIPMRDGKRLFTAVYVPKDRRQAYPILLTRTPYSVRPYGVDKYHDDLGPSPLFGKAGYIFVYQDVRGRWMSEGEFVNMRPHIADKKPTDIDESTDTYDTIDWLVKNVAEQQRQGRPVGHLVPRLLHGGRA